jgi:hypothetical protein
MSFGFGIQVVTDEDLPLSLAPLIDSTMHRISRLGSFCSNEFDDSLSRMRNFSTVITDNYASIAGNAVSVIDDRECDDSNDNISGCCSADDDSTE